MEDAKYLDAEMTINDIFINAICDADFRANDTTSSFFMIHFTVEEIQKLYLKKREPIAT